MSEYTLYTVTVLYIYIFYILFYSVWDGWWFRQNPKPSPLHFDIITIIIIESNSFQSHMEALSFHSVTETCSFLRRTPSSASDAASAGTPRLGFLKISQHLQSQVAPLRLSALPTQLPSEGDDGNASGLASQPDVPSLSLSLSPLLFSISCVFPIYLSLFYKTITLFVSKLTLAQLQVLTFQWCSVLCEYSTYTANEIVLLC